MKPVAPGVPRRVASLRLFISLLLAWLFTALPCHAAWQPEGASLAWVDEGRVVWRFNYDAADGKPFFHPLSVGGADPLTVAGPADHPWHYGLWFSWKYINGVNYWEQDRQTGVAEGKTTWAAPVLQTNANGSASINLDLQYVHPSGRVELTEQRRLRISPAAADGSYTIDWTAKFTVGREGVKLDRTPMLGEPNGQVNGGYAGLSLRLAAAPITVALVSEHGPVTEFASDRARPEALALACNFSRADQPLGAIAILSDAGNVKGSSPWYAVIAAQMRFYCSAILAPAPLQLKAGEERVLHYRILVRPQAWNPQDLETALREWNPAK